MLLIGLTLGTIDAQQRVPPGPVVAQIEPRLAERNLRQKVAPQYPDSAREARVQGVVRVVVRIGSDGRIQEARVVRGPAMLREAALSAVERWVYDPFVRNGQAVPVMTEIDVPFTLR